MLSNPIPKVTELVDGTYILRIRMQVGDLTVDDLMVRWPAQGPVWEMSCFLGLILTRCLTTTSQLFYAMLQRFYAMSEIVQQLSPSLVITFSGYKAK